MTNDRYSVYIKGRAIPHNVACRDWVCGNCGGRLVTRWFEDAPHWRTLCFDDGDHDPDGFVHKGTWAYLEARRMMDGVTAREVFKHLPPEVQAAIEAA